MVWNSEKLGGVSNWIVAYFSSLFFNQKKRKAIQILTLEK